MAHPQFRLFRGRGNKFYFNLTSKNGQKILQSQGYATRPAARNGVKAVKSSAKRKGLYEGKRSSNGKYYFVLTSPNGQTIGKSEMYSSSSGRSNGMKSVMKNAGPAKIVDDT